MMISKRTGFTLIELLVVIAIIAILAAILFPVFARARAKAQQASCLSNTKQTALSFLMYNSDYDGFCPVTGWENYVDPITGHYRTGCWWHPIWPYIERDLLQCPATDAPIFDWKGVPTGGTGDVRDYTSDFNANYDNSWENWAPCEGLWGVIGQIDGANTDRIPNPTEVIMFFEHNGWYSVTPWVWGIFHDRIMYPGNHQDGAGMHFAFVDGHAKYVNTEGCPPVLGGDPIENSSTWKGITFCRGYARVPHSWEE